MVEPQIKAKLVLDTSQLQGITGSSGNLGSSNKGKGDNDTTKLLRDIVKGQAPISNLANKLLGVIVGGALDLGGLGVALGIGGIAGGLKALSSAIESDQGVTEEEIKNTDEAILEEKEKIKEETDKILNPTTGAKVSTEQIDKELKFINEKTTNWAGSMEDTNKGQGTISANILTTDKILDEVGDKADEWLTANTDIVQITKQIATNLKKYMDSIPGSFATTRTDPNVNLDGYENTSSGTVYDFFNEQNKQSIDIENAGLGNPEE